MHSSTSCCSRKPEFPCAQCTPLLHGISWKKHANPSSSWQQCIISTWFQTKSVLTSCGGTQYLCQGQSTPQWPTCLLPFRDRKPAYPTPRPVPPLCQTWKQDIAARKGHQVPTKPVGKRALPKEGNNNATPAPQVLLHLLRLEADREVELPPLHQMEREVVKMSENCGQKI